MYFLTVSSANSFRMKITLPSRPTIAESISILYYSLSTAFLATAASFSKSQISILLCFQTCTSFSTSLLRVASSSKQTCVSLTFIIFLMTSLGKLWIMTSLSLFQIKMNFFSMLMPTSSPLALKQRFSTGYLSDSVQSRGSVLFYRSHLLTPWLEMLKYSLCQLCLMIIFLNYSFAFINDATSLAPFLEQILIFPSLIQQQWLLSISVRQVMFIDLLYRSSRRLYGSSSNRLLVVFQKRQTLGFKSIDWKIAISSLSSLHSSNSGRCTSKEGYYFQILPSLLNFQKYSNLSSPSSSDVSIARQLFLAYTFSIIVGRLTPSLLTTLKLSREMTQKLYIPNTPTSPSLMALSLAQKMSSLDKTSMDVLNVSSSRSQMKSWVPSMSRRQGPTASDSQREGLQRQYLPC